MECPKCGDSTKVIDSRTKSEGKYRRRECLSCFSRFSTIEERITKIKKVIKKEKVKKEKRKKEGFDDLEAFIDRILN